MSSEKLKIIVVGGGAAGFFGAITCKEAYPEMEVILMEKARQVLAKVRVSGGGRCNVTHSCFDVATLVKHYPRGEKALKGPFTRFQPENTIEWFLKRGVSLKKEADGRMFPVTDSSETIIECLMTSAKKAGVHLKTECGIQNIAKHQENKDSKGFTLTLGSGEEVMCDKLLMATGSNSKIYGLLENLGHKIVPPVPSLFTFNVPDSPLSELSGIGIPKVHLKLADTSLEQTGALLITHFGFSGPAVLKLSAWGARALAELDYKAVLNINWLPDLSYEELKQCLIDYKQKNPLKLVTTESPINLPKNLWKALSSSTLTEEKAASKWSHISLKQINQLTEKLKKDSYQIQGKTTFKEEFVTCGGVSLDEVDFKTMESKVCKGLYFAGELLDIDGITGGFNFQNAWTTSWIAGQAIGLVG